MAADVANEEVTFSIADIKLFVPVATLSTQDNTKLFEQLKSGFKRTINWNKYQPKVSTERLNQYLDFLIDPSFQEVNRLFVLSLENEAQGISNKQYYLPTREIKNYNVHGQNLFGQPVRYDNIRNIATGQADDYTTGCLLDNNNFKKIKR